MAPDLLVEEQYCLFHQMPKLPGSAQSVLHWIKSESADGVSPIRAKTGREIWNRICVLTSSQNFLQAERIWILFNAVLFVLCIYSNVVYLLAESPSLISD